ncbi:hypothetical protein QYE76_004765 [Lolium multiflorum]|uniref:Transposase n=1 Tax=Lolium multiflorum TaxID=4521 RepID=A0AAD8W041_LOLMU|nr:hypothetical protein QYE76_004765 [Lolium multiflorum]
MTLVTMSRARNQEEGSRQGDVVCSYNELKRLFGNKEHAKLLRWHKEDRKSDGELRHPADGTQWRKIDREFKDFAADARNIRFGLSTDGMNPFGEQSSSHSTWPVTLCIYNLPPWLCMKRKFIMMPVLIQGPKQPDNDIDVYLRPLVDEVLQLWGRPGVRVWDEHKEEEFDLRALLFVTINDWPALSNLSGQSNKGYNACTHLHETESVHLPNCKKNVYLGHRRFLPKIHPVRKKGKHYNGKADHRPKPAERTGGAEVFDMVKDLKVIFGKGPGGQSIPDGHAPMWKKKSIFWELEYWKVLDVLSAIDVMHVTKNICVNLLSFLGVYGKTNDTKEARQDQQRLKDPDDQHPEWFQGRASYALTKEEKVIFFECLSKILVRKYSRNWTKSTPGFLFCPGIQNTREPQRRALVGQMTWWRGPGPGRATLWSRRLVDPLRRLFAYIKPHENPYGESHDTRKVPEPPSSRSQDRGQESLFRHPAGAGKCSRKASPSTPLPSPPPSSSPLLLP